MAAYMVVDIVRIKDPTVYARYIAAVAATVTAHHGRYLVRGGTVTSLAGGWAPQRVTIIEFPSVEHIRTWWASPEYRQLAPLRESSTESRAIVLEGYAENASQP